VHSLLWPLQSDCEGLSCLFLGLYKNHIYNPAMGRLGCCFLMEARSLYSISYEGLAMDTCYRSLFIHVLHNQQSSYVMLLSAFLSPKLQPLEVRGSQLSSKRDYRYCHAKLSIRSTHSYFVCPCSCLTMLNTLSKATSWILMVFPLLDQNPK
jgi:hypothetical protein